MIDHAVATVVLREDPLKLLYVGFDTVGRPREVIVDHPPWEHGLEVCIRADTLTPAWHELLWQGR